LAPERATGNLEIGNPMKLIAVSVGMPRPVRRGDEWVSTGIFKSPVAGSVHLGPLGLDGDGQADPENHGGEYLAVYAYSIEYYAYWAPRLDRKADEIPHGSFGENFTVEGMLDDEVSIGDVYRIGTALVQVTQPRPPCYKLDLRLGRKGFAKEFLASGRVGCYFRVLEPGEVVAGDSFERMSREEPSISVTEMSRLRFFASDDLVGARRALQVAALSPRWRRVFEERVEGEDDDG